MGLMGVLLTGQHSCEILTQGINSFVFRLKPPPPLINKVGLCPGGFCLWASGAFRRKGEGRSDEKVEKESVAKYDG